MKRVLDLMREKHSAATCPAWRFPGVAVVFGLKNRCALIQVRTERRPMR